jgi:hypothetical protein
MSCVLQGPGSFLLRGESTETVVCFFAIVGNYLLRYTCMRLGYAVAYIELNDIYVSYDV